MTTNRDTFDKRIVEENWGEHRENSQGVPIDGFADPTGEYPKRDYFFGSSINKSVTGEKINVTWISGSHLGIDFQYKAQFPSLFPFSQSNETPSGHAWETDDTPGSERLLIKHRTGAGVELKADGSVIVSSRNVKLQTTAGDDNVIVSGTGNMIYEGNLNMKVTGDYNLKVGGDFNLSTGGKLHERIGGSHRMHVGENESLEVQGDKDLRVGGSQTDIVLMNHRMFTKGTQNFSTEERFEVNANGDVNLTSKLNLIMAAENIGTNSQTLNMTGHSGIIGGDAMEYHGKVYTGPTNGEGNEVSFYGSLHGRAFEAWTCKYANYARNAFTSHHSTHAVNALMARTAPDGPGGAYTSSRLSPITSDPTYNFDKGYTVADPEWVEPDIEMIDLFLRTNDMGIKNTIIDEDNLILSKISPRVRYFGQFHDEPTLERFRSRYRSFSKPGSFTPEEQSCIDMLLAEKKLGYDFLMNMPTDMDIGRRSDRSPDYRLGHTLLGNPRENRSKKFFPNKYPNKTKSLLPDPVYNPDTTKEKFTMETKLAPGVSIGRFLGSAGSKTTLDHLPLVDGKNNRIDVIRQLYLHAQVIEQFETNPDFQGYKLVVTESFYDETEFEDTSRRHKVNQYKNTGQTVVYKIINTGGNVDFAKTYDLAFYWKDYIDFEELILDYDIYHPLSLPSVQLVLKMPKIDKSFKATFKYLVKTHYNGHVYSANELVELIPNKVLDNYQDYAV
jgi:hypothetical protein